MTSGLGSRSLRAARQRLRRRLQTRNERGFTLVEILIALILLGGIVVGMMGTLYTANVVSDVQRQQAVIDAEARRLEEKIRSHEYEKCAVPSYTGTSASLGGQRSGTNFNDYWPSDYQDALDAGTNADPSSPIDSQVHFLISDISWGYWDPSRAPDFGAGTAVDPTFKPWIPPTPSTDVDADAWTFGCSAREIAAAQAAGGASGVALPPGGLSSYDCGVQKITLQAKTDGGETDTYVFLKRSPDKLWPTCG